MTEFKFESFDGKPIHVYEWSDCAEPQGIIQIAHGMGEYTGRFFNHAEFFERNGFIVFSDDHRAHGKTDPDTLGYCAGDIFTDTLKDMAALTRLYKNKYPGQKVILLGHSYGSFLAQAYLERYCGYISGAVLSGSAYMKDLSLPFGYLVSKFSKSVKGGDAKADFIDKRTFQSYNKKFSAGTFISSVESECFKHKDDIYCNYVCSYNLYHSFFKGLFKLYSKERLNAIDKNLPVFIISGKEDPIGKYSKSVLKLGRVYKNAGIKDVRVKIYDNARHEVFNDICREEALNDVLEFCKRV